jgi:hypothetical protein
MPLRFACFSLILAFEALSLGAQESPPAAVPIDPIVLRPNVWESTPQELEPDLKILGFEWISADQKCRPLYVVASIERVLRYYGATVDQHELAQIANSDAAEGTSMDAMLASLKRLTARLGVKVRALYEWNIRDFLKMLEDYNRATKRGKLAPEVEIRGRMIDADSCFAQMKPEIFGLGSLQPVS